MTAAEATELQLLAYIKAVAVESTQLGLGIL